MNTWKIIALTTTVSALVVGIVAGCGGGNGLGLQNGAALLATAPTPTSPPGIPPLSAAIPLMDGHQMGATHWLAGDTSSGGIGQPVEGLTCAPMVENYHVHAHVSMFVDGQQFAVPLAIGITNPKVSHQPKWPDGFVYATSRGCHYSLHTHDTSGKIHIEATAPTRFTLGQFFSLWGQTLSSTNVAGYTQPVAIFIRDNGPHDTRIPYQYTGDFREIDLINKREITVQIGSPISQLPTYNWNVPKPTPTPTATGITAASVAHQRAQAGEAIDTEREY